MEKVSCPAVVYEESQLCSYGLWRKSAVQLRSMEKVSCPATVYGESQLCCRENLAQLHVTNWAAIVSVPGEGEVNGQMGFF
jgi:hypothetical protein